MRIIDLTEADSERIEQVAALLVDGFSDTGSDGWRTHTEALVSVRESSRPYQSRGVGGLREGRRGIFMAKRVRDRA